MKPQNLILPVAASVARPTPGHCAFKTKGSIQAAYALFKPVWCVPARFHPAIFAGLEVCQP